MLPRSFAMLVASSLLAIGVLTPATATPTSPVATVDHRAADPSVVVSEPRHRATAAKFQANVMKWTNVARRHHGLHRLKKGKCVDGFADPWARHMAKTQQLVHQDLAPILKRCKASQVAENIAYGYPTAHATVRAWMHSKGHRANILNPALTNLGVGAARDKNGTWWVVQDLAAH
jgi:uncharacterized protein YkwD